MDRSTWRLATLVAVLIALLIVAEACREQRDTRAASDAVHVLPRSASVDLKPLQWDHAFIDLPLAWQYAGTLGDGAIVCDVDTGLDSSVADIAPAVVDAISTIDPTQPGQWSDDVGHGTFTAGQMVGRGFQLDGVAPRARLIVAQALDLAGGDFLAISSAILYCITHGAEVVNMSFGTSNASEHYAWSQLIQLGCENGVDFAIAAGNSGQDGVSYPIEPADIQSPCAITVNAVAPDGTIAAFSDYDQAPHTVSAPGVGIIGHWGSEVAMGDGTSFSAPLVAGTLALLRAQGASATEAVAEILKTAAPPVDPTIRGKRYHSLRRLLYGRGYLDAGSALRDWAHASATPPHLRRQEAS